MNDFSSEKIRVALFDLDGTVYVGENLLPGAGDVLAKLASAGIDCGFMTNNSSVGPTDYLAKLENLGLDVTERNIITSAEAATLMLDDLNLGPELFILGTAALKNYLAEKGFHHNTTDPAAVLVGFDPELTFDALTHAVRWVLKGRPYVATHPDVLCPSPDGGWPDAGSLIAAIHAATEADPQAVAGKPHRWIVDLVRRRFNVTPRQILLVGDRLDTDIRMARDFGMRSVLVLTGVTDQAAIQRSPHTPDRVIPSIRELFNTPFAP